MQPFPESAHSITAISDACACVDDAGLTHGVAPSLVEPAAIIRAVELYWPGTTARNVRLLYYPYVCARYRRSDGSGRVETFDAVSGKPNESVNRMMQTKFASDEPVAGHPREASA